MVFRRRDRRGPLRALAEFFWPRGGWRRAVGYMLHRMSRLPDTPERICIGIACGIFVSFLPTFGVQFILAAMIAWVLRGNILAAVLATFYENPVTFPFIAVTSMELGGWLLGSSAEITVSQVMGAIGRASSELWHNLLAPFTGDNVQWGRLQGFFRRVFLPYLLGGAILGLLFAIAGYYAHLPILRAHQRRRQAKLQARFETARQRERETRERDEP